MPNKNYQLILLEVFVFILTLAPFYTILGLTTKNSPSPTRATKGYKNLNISRRASENDPKVWLFKDYIKKFNPNVVFDRIDTKKKREGKNATIEVDFEDILEGMDPTDELLRLNVDQVINGRRKWTPSGQLNTMAPHRMDLFSYRERLWELMRHAMYRTRNKLVIMQLLRTKYRNSTLYKMGFLMSRTDTACKSFAAYAYRSIHACIQRRYKVHDRVEIITMMGAEERMNNKWFEIELLIDLIVKNDELAKETIAKNIKGRKQKWKYID